MEQQGPEGIGPGQGRFDDDDAASWAQAAGEFLVGSRVENIGCGEGAEDGIECAVGERQALRDPLNARDVCGAAAEPCRRDTVHGGGWFEADNAALPALQLGQQRAGAEADFEDIFAANEGEGRLAPGVPAAEADRPTDGVIGPGQLVVEKPVEKLVD